MDASYKTYVCSLPAPSLSCPCASGFASTSEIPFHIWALCESARSYDRAIGFSDQAQPVHAPSGALFGSAMAGNPSFHVVGATGSGG